MSTLFRRPSDLSGVSGADDDSAAKPRNVIYDKQMSAILQKYSNKDSIDLNKILNKYNKADVASDGRMYEAPSWLDERDPAQESPSSPNDRDGVEDRVAPSVESVTVAPGEADFQRVCSGLSNDNSHSTMKSSSSSKKTFPKLKLRRSTSNAGSVKRDEASVVSKASSKASAPVVAPPAPMVQPALSTDVLSSPMNAEKMCLSLADSASHEQRSISGSHSLASKEQMALVEPELVDCSNLQSIYNEVVDPQPDVMEAVRMKRVNSKTSVTGSVSSRKSFLDKFRIRSSQRDALSVKQEKESVQVETVESIDDEASRSQSPSKSRFFGGKLFGKSKQPAPTTVDNISSFVDGCLVPSPDAVEPSVEKAPVAVADEDEALRDQALQDTIPSCCSGTDKSTLETLDALAETYLLPTPDAEVEVTTEKVSIPVEPVAPEETSREDPVPASAFCMNKSTTLDSLDAFADTYLLPTVESVIVPSPEDDVKRVADVVDADETPEGLEMTTVSSGFCLHQSNTMDTLDALAETYLLPTPDADAHVVEPVVEKVVDVPVVEPEVEKAVVQEVVKDTPVVPVAQEEKKQSAFDALDSFAERFLLPTPDVVEVKGVPPPKPEPEPEPVVEPAPVEPVVPTTPASSGFKSPLDVLDSLAETYLLPSPDVVAESPKVAVEETATTDTKELKKKKGWFW